MPYQLIFMRVHSHDSNYSAYLLLQYIWDPIGMDGVINTMPRSAVGNLSGYRCMSDCRSRGREFDPSPVPYFRGD